jgi:hypothetical protein
LNKVPPVEQDLRTVLLRSKKFWKRCCKTNKVSDRYCQIKLGWSEQGVFVASAMTKRFPFRYFKKSPEIIRFAAMLYVRFPL